MIVPMARIRVLGVHSRMEATLEVLHRARVAQILEAAREGGPLVRPYAPEDTQVKEADDLRYLAARLDSLFSLGPVPGPPPAAGATDLEEVRREVEEVGPDLEDLARRLDGLRSEREVLPRHLHAVRRLLPLVPELPALERYETSALLLDARHRELVPLLREELRLLVGNGFELVWAPVDPETLGVILVYPVARSAEVQGLLGRRQVSRVRLPGAYEGMPLRRAVGAMEERIASLDGEIDQLQERLAGLLEPRLPRWKAARRVLAGRLDLLSEMGRLATTDRTFVLLAWVPRPRLADLADTLRREVGPEVVLEELPLAEEEMESAPVLLDNPRACSPFELLVALYALPRYGTLDPTLLMTLFLPLFFGFMLGDLGYGLVLALLVLVFRRTKAGRSPVGSALSSVLLLGSVSSVLFGFAFGEFFGNVLHLRPLVLSREEALGPLLVLSLVVGFGHTALGLVLGVFSGVRQRHLSQAAERAGSLVALGGLFLVAAAAARQIPREALTPGVAALLVGAAVAMASRGPMGLVQGPLELVGLVGGVLSYLRLAALGLASVHLARMANELGALLPLWAGIVVVALLHSLNLVLGAFSPTVQALRLHYVEFFRHFYSPGGKAFAPFGADEEGSQPWKSA